MAVGFWLPPVEMFLQLLFAFAAVHATLAAQCCGRRGDWNENKLWEARQRLCENPWRNEWVDGGRQAKVTAGFWQSQTDYVMWGSDGTNQFRNCWDATANMITQCARNNNGVGSWQYGSEAYAMSASQGYYRKRDEVIEELPHLGGEVSNIDLVNATYLVDGVPVDIEIDGSNFFKQELSKRDELHQLQTTHGLVSNWTQETRLDVDLSSLIRQIVQDAQADSVDSTGTNLTRRGQACSVRRSNYAMVEAGFWWPGWEPASSCYKCGQSSTCSGLQSWSKSWTEEFSIGLSGSVKGAAAEAAGSLGYSWSRTSTQGGSFNCQWNKGGCHVLYSRQPMTWQRGFAVSATGSESYMIVTIKLVHGDAPRKDQPDFDCNRGCCAGNTCNWSFCQYAQGKEDWYGVCNNYDNHPWNPDCGSW